MFVDEKAPGEVAVVDSPAIAILRKAKNILEVRGWCQDQFCDWETGSYCMIGALCRAHAMANGSGSLYEDVEDRLMGAIHSNDIPMWNDIQGRTKEEVLAAFDRAIACGW